MQILHQQVNLFLQSDHATLTVQERQAKAIKKKNNNNNKLVTSYLAERAGVRTLVLQLFET
jgi:hypothetical protein